MAADHEQIGDLVTNTFPDLQDSSQDSPCVAEDLGFLPHNDGIDGHPFVSGPFTTGILSEPPNLDFVTTNEAFEQWLSSEVEAVSGSSYLPAAEQSSLISGTISNADFHDVFQSPINPSPEPLGIAVPDSTASHDSDSLSISMPKIGTRFSRDSLRILKQWFAAHSHDPYPDEKTKETLQTLTGLNKTQVLNWLANARRRTKTTAVPRYMPPKATQSHVVPIDVPNRSGTPIPRPAADCDLLNPLERWVDSPPEQEPADASAIAKAVAAHGQDPLVTGDHDIDKAMRNRYKLVDSSSGSSAGSSSMGSASSANSNSSAGRDILGCARPRRRKRTQRRSRFITPTPYACTFCTETFRRKHDWQRHETSIHLSLERWRCLPNGPLALNPATNTTCCVFCGEPEPTTLHVKDHNPSACVEHTFNRKDHLKQHLKLVHRANFIEWSMNPWKVSLSEVRSRCGICRKALFSWSERAEHLAEHFKIGHTMASWEGDWGFEQPIQEMVENAIPPYLIHDERATPFPFQGSGGPADSPRSAYELITLELIFFVQVYCEEMEAVPSNEAIQLEACRIIFASEMQSLAQGADNEPSSSWLRDLITSNEEITQQAQFQPIRSRRENRLSVLKINGKRTLFDGCPLELDLQNFVLERVNSGQVFPQDYELQQAARTMVEQMEQNSSRTQTHTIANWLIRSIWESSHWLHQFKQRAQMQDHTGALSMSFNTESSNVQSEGYLFDSTPTVMHQPVGIQASQPNTSGSFHETVNALPHTGPNTSSHNPIVFGHPETPSPHPEREIAPSTMNVLGTNPIHSIESTGYQPSWVQTGLFMLNDCTYQERLSRALCRWIASQISPRNPNPHVPSDAEIQHQSRWMAYGDDDPWNQTPADNPEWLERLKRKAGILPT